MKTRFEAEAVLLGCRYTFRFPPSVTPDMFASKAMLCDPRTTIRLFRTAESGIEPVYARTKRTFARHFHDQFGIGVVHSGAQQSASGRGPVEAVQGDIITVNPGEIHDGSQIGDEPRSWSMLYFDPDRLKQIALDMSEGRSAEIEFAEPVRTDPVAASLFHETFRLLVQEASPELGSATETLPLLVSRLTVRVNEPAKDRQAGLGFVRARQAIDDDPTARRSLDELASIAGTGRFRLIRAFAAETGLTPQAYAMQRRLQAARRLLRQGLPIAQVAAEAGFSDQSHMTRLFSRSYGLTPGLYARSRG